MRFERVVIRNFRAIRDYRLELPPNGVVIVEGENELGKSSIAEALWMVFEYPDSSENERVRAVKPVDRDSGAEIEVTVSTGPYRFEYRKRYHRNHQTLLRIESPKREDLTGREAHDRVRQILEETADMALWEALRMLQGEALDEVSVGGNLSIARALDEAAISSLGGEREQTLFERVEGEYLRYFTRTGRENKEYANRRETVQRHQADAARLDAQLRELEAMAERCATLDGAIARLNAELEIAAAERADLQGRAREREHAVAAVKEQEAAAAVARSRLGQADALRQRRAEASAEIEALTARIDSRRVALNDAAARLGVFENAFAEAERQVAAAREKLETVSAAVEVAQADYSYMHEQLQVQQMSARLERVRQAQQKIREAAEFLNSCAVNPRIIAELEDAERAIAVDKARLEAEEARVDVSADRDVTVEVDGVPRTIPSDGLHIPVASASTLRLPGGIEVRVSAGKSVAEVQRRLDLAVRAFEATCRDLRVASLEEARALEARRSEAVAERRHLEAQIRADLDDLSSAEELAGKIERDRQRGLRHVETRRALAPMPANLQEARDRANSAREAETRAKNELSPLEASLRAAQNGAVSAADRVRGLERELEADTAQVERQREWLETRRLEMTDEALAAEHDAASAAVEDADRLLAESRERLAALADVSGAVAEAVGREASIGGDLRRAEDELNRLAGALAHAGESGLHQQRERALTEQTAAEAELDAFGQRADAARMLFETMKRYREAAQRSYARPLEERLNELGQRVFNSTFAIELDADLKIARRTLDGTTLDFRHLSGGAKEQLGILMRLACASLVSESGGVPLILDDVLGWSDPRRVQRLGEVLAEAGREVQVIVLTCTPERFASVAPGTVISLPSGRVRAITAGAPPTPVLEPAPPPPVPRRSPHRPPETAGSPRQAGFDLFDTEPATPR